MLTTLLPFAAIIVVFYFLLIRPENKRKKTMQKMLSELIVGDEVTTIGGIIGKVVNIKDDEITLKPARTRSASSLSARRSHPKSSL
jgi:preprotein translocase subunit YajC